MFGSIILDVGIGVIFIYLFLSLICSAFAELISGFRKMRAKNLEEGIRYMLNDPSGNCLTKKIYEHPLIKALTKDKRKPSYIPSRTFALTLLYVIAPAEPEKCSMTIDELREKLKNLQCDELKKVLCIYLNESENNINKLRENIETWFNESMERVSGWYKRKIQWVILGLALLVSVIFNADTLYITTTLYNNSTVRSGLVAAAEEIAKQPLGKEPEDVKAKIKEINAQLESLNFPIGIAKVKEITWEEIKKEFRGKDSAWWLTKILGWLVTSLAISLGAPFWFDMLKRLINIRSSGKQPESGKSETKGTT